MIFNLFAALLDLPDALQNAADRGSNRNTPSSQDIFCLVKKYICEEDLGQRPLLVLTKAAADRVADLPEGKHSLRNVSADVKGDWRKLATTVEQYYGPSYTPASQYLQRLCEVYFHQTSEPCALPWLTVRDERIVPEPVLNLHKCILDALAPSAPLRAAWQRRP